MDHRPTPRRSSPRLSLAFTLLALLIISSLPLQASADPNEIGATWTNLSPPSAPPVRSGHAMAPLVTNARVLLFGGCNGGKLGDTWQFDTTNATWTNLTPSPSPPIRYSPGLAHDPLSRRTVLFGGAGPSTLNDTWLYDDVTGVWSNVSTPSSPKVRQGHVMAFAPYSRRMVMFGGVDGADASTDLNDTWVYDPVNNTWTDARPSGGPSPRYWPAFAHVGPGDRMMLYGGGAPAIIFGDQWFYQLENNSWWRSTPMAAPGARRGTTLALQPSLDRIVLFGGTGAGLLDDTWSYERTAGTWTNITPPGSPGKRTDHSMVFDPANGKFVMFGGFQSPGPSFYLNDTWVLELTLPLDESSSPSLLFVALAGVVALAILTSAGSRQRARRSPRRTA